MYGAYFIGDKRFETHEMHFAPLAEKEVLVKVAACGVCGTDVHIYHGEKGSAKVTPPVVLGHEYAGVVEAVGCGVSHLKSGDHVAVDPNIYCGQCPPCRAGKKQLCENLQAIGVTRNGGFAEYCICPEPQCFLLKPHVPFTHGAMAEPLSCCLHGIDRAGIRQGGTVAVVGGGAIGLIMVQLARLAGASKVLLVEPVSTRRDIGMQVGADGALDPLCKQFSEKVHAVLDDGGTDIVIECAGNQSAVELTFSLAKDGASILLFSVPKPGATFNLPLMDVYNKELSIQGSFINPDTFQRAVDMINASRLLLDPVITHHFPLEDMEKAILMQMSSESIKVLVLPSHISVSA